MMQMTERGARFGVATCVLGLFVFGSALGGCGGQMSDPDPGAEGGDGGIGATEARFSCVDRPEEGDADARWIVLESGGFRPSAESISGGSEVVVRRTADIYGEFDGGYRAVSLGTVGDAERIRRNDSSGLEIRLDPEIELPPGIYDVVAENAAGETARAAKAFGVAPRPEVETVAPGLSCVDQGARPVTVQGGPFLEREGDSRRPDVRIAGKQYAGEDVEAVGCRELGEPFGSFRACSGLEVAVDPSSERLETGEPQSVTVQNPEPAACSSRSGEEAGSLYVTPPPSVESIRPVPLCSKQRTYEQLKVDGSNFVQIQQQGATILPTVRIQNARFEATELRNCEPIPGLSDATAQRCSTAVVRVQAGELDRLAEQTSTPLQAVGDAGLDAGDTGRDGSVDSGSDAGDGGGDGGTDSGVDAALDTGADTGADRDAKTGVDAGPGGVDADTGDGGGDARDTDLPRPPGPTPTNNLTLLDVSVENPSPTECSSGVVSLPVVPPPVVHDTTPDPVCNSDARTLTVQGSSFLVVGDRQPSVTVAGTTYPSDRVSDCAELPPFNGLDYTDTVVRSCLELEVTVPAGEFTGGGTREVTVTNPEPAHCSSEGSAPLQSTPAPAVDRVEPEVQPASNPLAEPVCTADGARTLVVYGSNFYAVRGDRPSVTVRAGPMGATLGTWEARSVSGCAEVPVDDKWGGARRCSVLRVALPKGALQRAPGSGIEEYALDVTNPRGAACTTDSSTAFYAAAPPKMGAMAPVTENFACLESGDRTFEVSGSGFLRYERGSNMNTQTLLPLVEVDGNFFRADSVSNCSMATGSMSGQNNRLETCSELTFTIPQKGVGPSGSMPHDVRVHQPGAAGCAGTSTAQLAVDPPPTVTDVETPLQSTTVVGTQYQADDDPICSSSAPNQPDDTLRIRGDDIHVVEDPSGNTTLPQSSKTFRIPKVEIAAKTFNESAVELVDPGSNCSSVGGGSRTREVYACSTLDVDVPSSEKSSLSAGTHKVTVINPDHAPDQGSRSHGCRSSNDERVRLSEEPKLTGITPDPVETAQSDQTLRASGGDYLFVEPKQSGRNERKPQVTFECVSGSCTAGNTVTYSDTVEGRKCVGKAMGSDDPRVENCAELVIPVPQQGTGKSLTEGTYSATVQNPINAECTSGSVQISVVAP